MREPEAIEPIDDAETLSIRPLRVREYELLAEAGAFENEKVELLYGRIVPMSPQGTEHAFSIVKLTKILVLALGDLAYVRPQLPFVAGEYSMPEPDFAIVSTNDIEAHPDRASLVIEVSFSSLRLDRRLKARLYAEQAIPEYWVVDVAHGEVIVHRDPGPTGYRRIEHVGRGTVLVPTELPTVRVAVTDILPPAG